MNFTRVTKGATLSFSDFFLFRNILFFFGINRWVLVLQFCACILISNICNFLRSDFVCDQNWCLMDVTHAFKIHSIFNLRSHDSMRISSCACIAFSILFVWLDAFQTNAALRYTRYFPILFQLGRNYVAINIQTWVGTSLFVNMERQRRHAKCPLAIRRNIRYRNNDVVTLTIAA